MCTHRFTLADQNHFALLSGDYNPLHINPLAARRSQFGRPLVHGIHLVLWSLEHVMHTQSPASLSRISCIFRNPVTIDEEVTCHVVEHTDSKIHIEIKGRDKCTELNVELAPPRANGTFENVNPAVLACHASEPGRIQGAHGSLQLQLSENDFVARFPKLSTVLPFDQLAVILATTRLVGMQCPGLRSIYSEFDLDFKAPLPSQTPVLFWQVKNYDDRFLRTEIAITALGAQGSIVAMLRPGPRQQPSTEEIRRRLPHHEQFAGRNALIIGGSRGLGEICAKLLAAGGADVCLTYHRGKDDADVVVGDIRQAGGKAINFAYDVLSPTHNLLSQFSSDWVPTHIYYFPTPPIFIANRNQFSPEIFEKFCQYYVNGFYACWSAVRAITPQKLVMLYPSSVAVETVYSNMGEYAAAKAAGENLCKFLVQTDRALQIKVARLPRLPSDQTLSLLEDDMEDPVEILLSQLQECKRRLKDA